MELITPNRRTMTLNLPEHEMALLDALSNAKDMTKTAVLRKALRLYSVLDERMRKGEKIVWQRPDGSIGSPLFVGSGCDGWDGF